MVEYTKSAEHIEIYGLDANTMGRACVTHEVCAQSVSKNNVLVLGSEIVKMEEVRLVTVVKACKAVDGTRLCSVGFLPKSLLRAKELYTDFVCVVVNYLRLSGSIMVKRRNARFQGVARCKLLEIVEQLF